MQTNQVLGVIWAKVADLIVKISSGNPGGDTITSGRSAADGFQVASFTKLIFRSLQEDPQLMGFKLHPSPS